MFKKAQLKLFAIITCILLAIFIAVLGSVNIIMQAVMERQSKDVLKKIASGVEYDEKTSRFNITRPENFGQKPENEPPPKPDNDRIPPSTEEEETSGDTTETTTTSVTAPPQTETSVTTTSVTSAKETTKKTSVTTTAVTTASHSKTVTKTATTSHKAETTTKNNDDTIPPWFRGGGGQYEPPKWGGEEQQPYTFPNYGGGDQQPFTFPNYGGGDQQPFTFPNYGGSGQQQYTFPNYGGNGQQQYTFPNYGGNDQQQFTYPQYGYYGTPIQPFWDYSQQYNSNAKLNEPDPRKEDVEKNDDDEKMSATGEDFSEYLMQLGNADSDADEDIRISDFEPDGMPLGEQHDMNDSVPRSLGTIDFFIIMADKDGNYMAQLNNDDIDQDTAQKYISAILKASSSSGMIEDCYQFYQMEKNNGTIMVFTDKSAEMDMLRKLNRTTVLIGTVSLLFLTAAAFFLSRQVMKPLRTAFDKQKQFISDASHELKTPLTVISANADVLSGEIGDNRWLNYIKSQTERMNVLVNDLLNLTRLENNSSVFTRTDFDLSKAVINTALPFECQAFDSEKQLDVDVEPGLSVNGSERHIKQMVAIFIDNALKYSDEGGKVKVTLRKQGDKKVLTVFNTGKGVKSGEEEKIFERFYRSDESRNRSTGGYGLGLAIAKSIIDKHKFKVHVENEEGKSIAFVVTM